MKKIKAQPITHEAFAPFGSFYSMEHPDGFALQGAIHQFYPDRMVANNLLCDCCLPPFCRGKTDELHPEERIRRVVPSNKNCQKAQMPRV